MYLYLFVSLICVLIGWFLTKWYRVKNYWKHRGVPHNPPHIIYGSLTFLQKINATEWMLKMYKDFKRAPYIGIWVFWRPGLIVNTPELARRILVKDFDNFRDRLLSSGRSDPVGGLNIFTVNEPTWSYVRRRLTAAFTGAKLRAIEVINQKKSKALVEKFRRSYEKGEEMFMRKTFTDYTTDVTGESAFGIESNSIRDGDSVMRKVTREFSAFNTYRSLCWSSIFFWPELVDIFRLSFFPKDTTEYLRQIFRSVIKQRGGFDKEVKDPRDLLDVLIKFKQEAVTENEEISEDLLLAQAAILLFGGYDTTGSALTWISYELSHSPQCQDTLYNELVEAKAKLNGEEFTSNVLAELPYMNAIIKETLRRHSPMGWLDRIAEKSYKIDDSLTIEPGTVVYVNTGSMQHDPEYFPDPDKFDPERFLGDNEKNLTPYTYSPFGEGPRACIGQRFAWQTMRFAMAALFLEFRLSAAEGARAPHAVPGNRLELLNMAGHTLTAIFTPRNKT